MNLLPRDILFYLCSFIRYRDINSLSRCNKSLLLKCRDFPSWSEKRQRMKMLFGRAWMMPWEVKEVCTLAHNEGDSNLLSSLLTRETYLESKWRWRIALETFAFLGNYDFLREAGHFTNSSCNIGKLVKRMLKGGHLALADRCITFQGDESFYPKPKKRYWTRSQFVFFVHIICTEMKPTLRLEAMHHIYRYVENNNVPYEQKEGSHYTDSDEIRIKKFLKETLDSIVCTRNWDLIRLHERKGCKLTPSRMTHAATAAGWSDLFFQYISPQYESHIYENYLNNLLRIPEANVTDETESLFHHILSRHDKDIGIDCPQNARLFRILLDRFPKIITRLNKNTYFNYSQMPENIFALQIERGLILRDRWSIGAVARNYEYVKSCLESCGHFSRKKYLLGICIFNRLDLLDKWITLCTREEIEFVYSYAKKLIYLYDNDEVTYVPNKRGANHGSEEKKYITMRERFAYQHTLPQHAEVGLSNYSFRVTRRNYKNEFATFCMIKRVATALGKENQLIKDLTERRETHVEIDSD